MKKALILIKSLVVLSSYAIAGLPSDKPNGTAGAILGSPIRSRVSLAIVHSYEKDHPWSLSVQKGFVSKLRSRFYVNVRRIYSLNAKSEPENSALKAREIKKEILADKKINLVLTTDDEAFDLVGKEILSSENNVRVFATGQNRWPSEYGSSLIELQKNAPSNLGAVLESYNVRFVFKIIKKVLPLVKNVRFFFDESKTSKFVLESIKKDFKKAGNEKLEGEHFGLNIDNVVVSNDMSVWKGKLKRGDPFTDLNLIFPFSLVKDLTEEKNRPRPTQFAQWISKNSYIPEISSASVQMKFPFFAQTGVHGMDHGLEAGQVAIEFLKHSTKYLRRIQIGTPGTLSINADRAKRLRIQTPFEVMSYIQALRSNRSFSSPPSKESQQ